MSLTSHLNNKQSPVRAFMDEHFPYTAAISKECRARLRGADTITLTPALTPGEYGLVGTAFDYCVRLYFAPIRFTDLAAWHGMRALYAPPRYFVLNDPYDEPPIPREVESEPIVAEELGERLARAQEDLAPVGRRLERPSEELLARFCLVLALYERIYRSGRGGEALPGPDASVDDLLMLPEAAWVDDLCALSWAFYDENTALLEDLPRRTLALNPTFAGSGDVGGADADLIVDGCLIDLKTTIQQRWPYIVTDLYQFVGYALLDYDDRYAIRDVAIYQARQRAWFRWPLDAWLDALAGTDRPSLSDLRGQFRRLVGDRTASRR